MKGKFDAHVLWPLAKKFQNWIVDQSTARDFTIYSVFVLKCNAWLFYNQHVIKFCSFLFKKSYFQLSQNYMLVTIIILLAVWIFLLQLYFMRMIFVCWTGYQLSRVSWILNFWMISLDQIFHSKSNMQNQSHFNTQP